MHPQATLMAWINVLGGVAVLGSYAHGLASHPATRGNLWGNLPESLQPLYTVSMFTAAAGYLLFTGFLFFAVDPERVRVGGRFDLGLFNVLYVVVLLPSALWLPLTFAMLEAPSPDLWLAIRAVLFLVGLGALGIIAALLALGPREPPLFYWLAVAGSIAFSFQTTVLDALVWPAYFPA